MTESMQRLGPIGTWLGYIGIVTGITGLLAAWRHHFAWPIVIFLVVWSVMAIAWVEIVAQIRLEAEVRSLRAEFDADVAKALLDIPDLRCASCGRPVAISAQDGQPRIRHTLSCPERPQPDPITRTPPQPAYKGRRYA